MADDDQDYQDVPAAPGGVPDDVGAQDRMQDAIQDAEVAREEERRQRRFEDSDEGLRPIDDRKAGAPASGEAGDTPFMGKPGTDEGVPILPNQKATADNPFPADNNKDYNEPPNRAASGWENPTAANPQQPLGTEVNPRPTRGVIQDYLTGDDVVGSGGQVALPRAADPEHFKEALKATGEGDPTIALHKAIANATDPDEKVALYRQGMRAFDTGRAAARVAADEGHQDKVADFLTHATPYVPNNSNTKFTWDSSSQQYIVNSEDLNTGQQQTFGVPADRMKEWIHSPDSQFHDLMKTDTTASLQKAIQPREDRGAGAVGPGGPGAGAPAPVDQTTGIATEGPTRSQLTGDVATPSPPVDALGKVIGQPGEGTRALNPTIGRQQLANQGENPRAEAFARGAAGNPNATNPTVNPPGARTPTINADQLPANRVPNAAPQQGGGLPIRNAETAAQAQRLQDPNHMVEYQGRMVTAAQAEAEATRFAQKTPQFPTRDRQGMPMDYGPQGGRALTAEEAAQAQAYTQGRPMPGGYAITPQSGGQPVSSVLTGEKVHMNRTKGGASKSREPSYSPVAGAETGGGRGGQRGLNLDEEGRTAGERTAQATDERAYYGGLQKKLEGGTELTDKQKAFAEYYENKIQNHGRAPQQQQEAPPPNALSALREGAPTTYNNGQVWTLRGGKPVRLQ